MEKEEPAGENIGLPPDCSDAMNFRTKGNQLSPSPNANELLPLLY